MPTTPPATTALPAAPNPDNRATFDTLAYPWAQAQETLRTQMGSLASNVYGNAVEAQADAVATAADAVATAADRVQTGLDVAAAAGAAASASNAATSESNAAGSASAALASKNLAADWADKLTEVVAGRFSAKYWAQQAQASLTGELVYRGGWDASSNTYPPAPVTGNFWKITVAGTLAGGAVNAGDDIIYNGSAWDKIDNTESVITYTTYAARADLRALTPASGDLALAESLGLFRWYSGSAEPDDDETCFATASGRWLLECPHWDVSDAMLVPDESAQDDRDEDSETRLTSAETRWPGRWMFGSANCSITSVTTLAQASFTATITGAAVNDYVIATPPNLLDARISVFARVTSADTITVYLNNPSASTATIATGSWEIAIFKEI